MFELENFPEACLNKFTVSCNRLQIVVPGRLWTKTTVGKNWVNWVDGKCLRGKMTKVNNNRLATLAQWFLSLSFGIPASCFLHLVHQNQKKEHHLESILRVLAVLRSPILLITRC